MHLFQNQREVVDMHVFQKNRHKAQVLKPSSVKTNEKPGSACISQKQT